MDEGHVKGASVSRCVVDEEGNVGVDEEEEEDAEEDRRKEEHAEDLWGVRRACVCVDGLTHAMAQSAIAQLAKTSERPTALTRVR